MSLRLRKGDNVVVLSGKEKGKKGKLLRFSRDGSRAFVEGVNLVRRFVRKTRQNPQGGSLEQEAPIHRSNLALYNDQGRPVRFRIQVQGDGTRTRVCPKTGQVLGYTGKK